jgi:hypothetical protein
MFKDSVIILDAIRRSIFTKSAATAAMCMSTLTIIPVLLYTETIKLTRFIFVLPMFKYSYIRSKVA